MFKHLLVPLDGSRLAEAVLPAAAQVARILDATLTLLHVVERNPPETVHSEPHLADSAEAAAYLATLAGRPELAGLRLERHVHTSQVSDVARSIVDHAQELGVDLVALCTHGRSGPRHWLFGSIAQQVINLGLTPVLAVRPDEAGGAPPFRCRRLLVPLDGDPVHEQGLSVAASLAGACPAALHLIVCVPTLSTLSPEKAATGKLLPQATTAMLDLAHRGAEDYLRRPVAELVAQGLAVTSEVCRGDPAITIDRIAQESDVDLIVLASHGRAGMGAFWAGSVSAKVAARSKLPLLLVPVKRESV